VKDKEIASQIIDKLSYVTMSYLLRYGLPVYNVSPEDIIRVWEKMVRVAIKD